MFEQAVVCYVIHVVGNTRVAFMYKCLKKQQHESYLLTFVMFANCSLENIAREVSCIRKTYVNILVQPNISLWFTWWLLQYEYSTLEFNN